MERTGKLSGLKGKKKREEEVDKERDLRHWEVKGTGVSEEIPYVPLCMSNATP